MADADAFVAEVNTESLELGTRQAQLEWVKATYITPDTEALAAEGNEAVLEFNSRIIEKTKELRWPGHWKVRRRALSS